jgi:hypothetical protein
VTECIDLRLRAGLPHEWIVGWNGAVVLDTKDFPALGVGILGIVAGRRDVEHSIASKGNARRSRGVEHEHVADLRELLSIPAAAGDRHAPVLVHRFRVRKIDPAVFGKLRVKRDIHVSMNRARQSGLTGPIGGWCAGYGLRREHSVADVSNLTDALCDKHAPVGQERETPGIGQPLGHNADADLLAFSGVIVDGLVEKRFSREALRRNGNVVLERNRLLDSANRKFREQKHQHQKNDGSGEQDCSAPLWRILDSHKL